MVGILKWFGFTGSFSILAVVMLFAGIMLPYVSRVEQIMVISGIIGASMIMSDVMYNGYKQVVEEKGWKAIFHPLTPVFIGSIWSVKMLIHILTI